MSVREFRIQGRKADGTTCCAGDDPSTMCDDCRAAASGDQSAPAPRRLSDHMNKSGDKHPNHGQPNIHGVPRPLSLAKTLQTKGGRR